MNDLDVGAIRNEKVEIKRKYESETEAKLQELKSELRDIELQMYNTMAEAAKYAGNLGLKYDPRSNSFYKNILLDADPVLLLAHDSQQTIDRLKNSMDDPKDLESASIADQLIDQDGGTERQFVEFKAVVSDPTDNSETNKSSDQYLDQVLRFEASQAEKVLNVSPRPLRPLPQAIPLSFKSNADRTTKKSLLTYLTDAVAWFISVPVAAFVGYGLVKIAGFVDRKTEYLRWPISIALGLGVIISLKLLFEKIWNSHGRDEALGHSSTGKLLPKVLVTMLFTISEAFLGATAIQEYSKLTSFAGAGEMSLFQALLIAFTISSPTLIYSAFKGYSQGVNSLTESDEENRARIHAESVEKERQKVLQSEYEDDLQMWKQDYNRVEEKKKLLHEAHLSALSAELNILKAVQDRMDSARAKSSEMVGSALDEQPARMEEYNKYRNSHDFQALCQSMSMVSVLSLRIETIRKEINSISISRGMNRASSF
jgi:hypothetical protein